MLTVTTKSGNVKVFNLETFEREKSFRAAWYSMSDMETKKDKKLKVTSKQGNFLFVIGNIQDVKFDEFTYLKGEVSSGTPKTAKEQDQENLDAILNKVNQAQDKAKRQKRESFIKELRERGIEPDLSDPFCLRCLESVEKSDEFKIPIYANVYAAAKNRR